MLNQMNVVAATRTTLVPDMLGSIVGSLDSGASSLSKVGYLPYGKSSSAGPFGFTGQRIDVETNGLYYYRARHFSPAWGRFLQPDPTGYSDGANVYAYVNNDPLNLLDPFGYAADSLQSGGSQTKNLTALAAVLSYINPIGTAQAQNAPDFVTSSGGVTFPVPTGATQAPNINNSGVQTGIQYSGGSGGGNGLDSRVTGLRIMDPTTGLYSYPNGYAVYMNQAEQTVNPLNGRTISRTDPFAHIDLGPPQSVYPPYAHGPLGGIGGSGGAGFGGGGGGIPPRLMPLE